jgi:hypothetical protein
MGNKVCSAVTMFFPFNVTDTLENMELYLTL